MQLTIDAAATRGENEGLSMRRGQWDDLVRVTEEMSRALALLPNQPAPTPPMVPGERGALHHVLRGAADVASMRERAELYGQLVHLHDQLGEKLNT